jgi:aspartate aminotransferase
VLPTIGLVSEEPQLTESRINARMRRIKPSPTSAAQDRAAQLRREGRDILNLVVGEPDFDTPAHIRKAACEAIERGETRYTQTAGTMALRLAIVEKLKRENGLSYEPGEIIVTCGAKHAIFNTLAVTLEPGDEVIIPAPYWVSYPDMALACDGTPVIVPTTEEDGFCLAPDVLERAMTSRTRWLVLNSPNNPTGAAYPAQRLAALAEVLMRHPQVLVLTDDIYEHIRFDGQQTTHLLNVEPRLRDRTVLVNGVSKTYAMTGWRIGYAAGPKDIVAALDMLQSQSTSNASSVSQAAALAALTSPASFLPDWVRTYRERRDRGLGLINAIPGLSCKTPGGAFYLYVNCSGLIGRRTAEGKRIETDHDVVMYFLDAANVAVVAGSSYGVSPFFRISIATSISVIEKACERMLRAIEALD